MTTQQPVQNNRGRIGRLVILLVLLLLLVIFLASQFGLSSTRPDQINAQINPRSTADYAPWEPIVINRVDPALGTQIALDYLATSSPDASFLVGLTGTFVAAAPTTDTDTPDTAVPTGNIATSIALVASDTPQFAPTSTLQIAPSATPTATMTLLPTRTETPVPTNTPVPTETTIPTGTATTTPTATATVTTTMTPSPTNTLIPTRTATLTNTPIPTITNTPLASNTPIPTTTNTPLPGPQVTFSHTQLTTTAPFQVSFTSIIQSGQVSTYQWTFGDGTISTEANPTHAYASAGFYAVTLSVIGPGGTDSEFLNIQVQETFAPPVANFGAAPTAGGAPLTVQFTDASTGSISSRVWNFGDGSGSLNVNPSHTYTSPGTYTAQLDVTGLGGSDSHTVIIQVSAAPVADFSFTQTPATLTVNFNSLSTGNISSYTWNFGDGSPASSTVNPSHTYSSGGTYDVSLTVNGTGGSNMITRQVTVNPLPVANFTYLQDSITPRMVNFTNISTGASSYSWDFGDGGNSTVTNPSYQYASTGTYSVTLTANGSGGTDTYTTSVVVDNAPSINFDWVQDPTGLREINFTDTSTGAVSAWVWDFGDGALSASPNPTHNYATSGAYDVTLTVSGGGGSETLTQTIQVLDPPTAAFTWVQDISGMRHISFDSSGSVNATTFGWDFGDGTIVTAANPTHDYATAGTYTVTLYVEGPGGYDDISDTVVVEDPPQAVFTLNPSPALVNQTVTITNTSTGDIVAYSWDFDGDGIEDESVANPPPQQYATPGTYIITLTAQGPGGTDSFSLPLDVLSPPDVSVSKSVNDNRPQEGDTITYTIQVRNNSTSTATGVVVNDPPPGALIFQSANAPAGTTYNAGVWTIGDLPGGATRTLTTTFTVDVLPDFGTAPTHAPAQVTNTATVTLNEADPNMGNNSASRTIRIVESDIAVTLNISNNTPFPGDNIIYTLTATNNGGRDATNVAITLSDNSGGMLNYVSDDSGGAYDPATGIWTVGGLTVGTTLAVNITIEVDPAIGQVAITSTATITASDQYDPITNNNSATDSIYIEVTDLRINKSVSNNTPLAGETITYQLQVRNIGLLPDTNVTVDDLLPAGVTYVSDDGGGDYAPGTGIWAIGSMAPNTTRTLNITVMVDAPGASATVTNTATVDGDRVDYNMPNNTSSVSFTIATAELSITKSANVATANPGDPVIYTITVNNAGPIGATNVVVNDELPASVNYVSDNSGGAYAGNDWAVGAIPNGGTATLIINVTVAPGATAGATITNTASITASDQYDTNSANDTASASFQVPAVDIALSKSASVATPNLGDPVTYVITVQNQGTFDATGITVLDQLPAGAAYNAANPHTVSQGTYDQATGIWNVGALNAAASATLTINTIVSAPANPGDTITNTASLNAVNQLDTNPANDSASVSFSIPSVDLNLSKSVSSAFGTLTPNGTAIIYTISVNNPTATAATGVIISDVLPGTIAYASDDSGGNYNPVTGVWTVGTIGAGNTSTLNINATVSGAAPGASIINTATIIAADQDDPDPANNSDTAMLTVPAVDIAVSKIVDSAIHNLGDTVIYTITVQNLGGDNATGLQLLDALPTGAVYNSHVTSSGTYTPGSGIWDIGALNTGASATLTINAIVSAPAAPGDIVTNTASLDSVAQDDTNPANDSASAAFTIPVVDLNIMKSVTSAFGALPPNGTALTYTIAVNNPAITAATGVTVQDQLPAGVLYVSDDSGGAYIPGSGIWTIGTIPAGGTATLTINATVAGSGVATPGSTITNTANISNADQYDPDLSNNTASAVITIPVIDLELSMMADNYFPNPGDTVTITLSLTNQGPNDATNVTVGTWIVGTLLAGNTTTTSYPYAISPSAPAGIVPLDAQVTQAAQFDIDSTPGNNIPGEDDQDEITLTILDVDMAVGTLVDNPTPLTATTIIYTITVDNLSANNASGVTVNVPLPAGVVWLGDDSGGAYDAVTGVWTIGAVPAGSPQLTLNISASVTATSTQTVEVTAVVDSAQPDLDATNNTSSVSITVP